MAIQILLIPARTNYSFTQEYHQTENKFTHGDMVGITMKEKVGLMPEQSELWRDC